MSGAMHTPEAWNDPVPAEWAIDRALQRFPRPTYIDGSPWKPAVIEGTNIPFANAVRFLAYEIERREDPPVDPDLLLAREIAEPFYKNAGQRDNAAKVRAGEFDGGDGVTLALAAIRAVRAQGGAA